MIYLDHHASAPLCEAAREALSRWYASPRAGNPSSVHAAGRAARAAMESARAAVAAALDAAPRELVFTSGGTEAVDLAVRGVGGALRPTRVVVDAGAHPCAVAAAEALCAKDDIEFTFWTSSSGPPADLRAGDLVVASWAQHETGAVAPVSAIGAAVTRAGAAMVVDAVQAWGKVDVCPGAAGALAVAISGHKVGAPSGVGALWLAPGARVEQRLRGGAQERGVRAGTENLSGVVGLGAAASAVGARRASMPEAARRRDRIEAALVALGAEVTPYGAERVATVTHVAFRDLAAQELVAALDLEGVCVSSGAACSSGKAEPSASITRLFPSEPWRARGALRVSLGPETTDAEVDAVVALLPRVVARFR
ncbi:MAG: aminotransferase class V-fold PLP-dependent enzyme [Polyangiales bacterium]